MSAVTADIVVEAELWGAQPQAEAIVREAIAAAALHSTRGGEVSILLSDDSAVRELNRQWRGLDQPTNVLSFPAPKSTFKSPAAESPLGDIVIAYETLQKECEDEGRDFVHHLAHLTVHGFLHLIGHDHQNDAEAEEMEAIESRIMIAMNMPDPWLTRDLAHGDV